MSLTRKSLGPAGFWTTAACWAAIMSFGGLSAQAQEAAPAEQPAAAPAPAAGTAGAGVPQPGWEKVCGNVKDQQECHISRRRVAATGQPLAQFMIIERAEKKLIQIAVPPVALIQPGIRVQIDENEATGVKYVVCTPGECLALGEINPDFVNNLKKGGKVVLTMLNPNGKPVAFDISLSGFTASYDGPGLNPAEAQARQQKLEDELKRKADAARQQLLNAQQQTTTTQ